MRLLTYLGFTMLSILIQFSVMDYIKEKNHYEGKFNDLNSTSPKKKFSDIIKDITHKPLTYYHTKISKLVIRNSSLKDETIFPDVPLTTNTIFDIFYDENNVTTETTFTTEVAYTTEYDNITEITLFEKKNQTSIEVHKMSKTSNKSCNCNLLYGVCDINCCCDMDCSEDDKKIFIHCNLLDNFTHNNDVCYLQIKTGNNLIDNLLCVVRVNLPEKQYVNKIQRLDYIRPNWHLQWKSNSNVKTLLEFKNKMYKYGDPVWLLDDGKFQYIDLPISMINNYCTGKKPIEFLKNEKVICNVKIHDIEMIQIMKTIEETTVISVTPASLNNSALNCSSLHCTNWTNIYCDSKLQCMPYNKSLHEPSCTESICTNLALKIDYLFYYHESKIVNATVKFYMQNTSTILPYMSQEINIMFMMSNGSVVEVLEFSGNPGYSTGFPIIMSINQNNYTANFYNNTSKRKHMYLIDNINGLCISKNISKNFIRFGNNKRIKCRYIQSDEIFSHNSSNMCKIIQNNIKNLLLFKTLAISPLGNPQDLRDEDWISIQANVSEHEPLCEELKGTKLYCHNLITRVFITFTFINIEGGYKILSAKYDTSVKNMSYNLREISTVLTTDINFIDITKPGVFEYAGSPHLNIHLPEDFFFPFPSNKSLIYCNNIYCFVLLLYIITLCK